MKRRIALTAVAVGALIATGVVAPGAASAAPTLASQNQGIVPVAQRIAATNTTYNAIEQLVANGQSLTHYYSSDGTTFYGNGTARLDILDYGLHSLWQKGIDGSGVTVAFVVTNPDPNLQSVMAKYDADMHLPPANITQMALPAPSSSKPCVVECDPTEDQLDAMSIHSMAPYAKLLFVSPPVPETVGMQGWPELAQAVRMISDRHLADVISISMGDHEAAFVNDPTNPGATQAAAVHSLDPAFLDAAAHNVPVLFSAGDCGPTGPTVLSDTGQCTPTMGVSADHPGDNPWVTAVGGTIPNAGLGKPTGRTAPDALWTGSATSDAAGAGVSVLYPKPSWQQGIPALAGVRGRAYPDISMDADDGTSQASPTLAGILALATQENRHSLGTINPALAAIGPQGSKAGIVDVPAGYSNSAYGVTGYSTAPGYDVASGWGTLYAPSFVPALVHQVDRQNRSRNTPAQQAAAQLAALQHSASVSRHGHTVTVTGRGFVPGRSPNGTTIVPGYGVYPPLPGQYGVPSTDPTVSPTATTPGQPWDTVTYHLSGPRSRYTPQITLSPPNGHGVLQVSINTSRLAHGRYTLTISGDELAETVSFSV